MKIFSIFVFTILFSINGISQSLPNFSFINSKNEEITPSKLSQNKPIVISYFDPYCEKCQIQASKIKENAAKFSGITIVYVSTGSNDLEDLETFRKKYFSSIQNLFVCKDETFSFDLWFGYSEVPSIYIYNKERKKTAEFTTIVSVEEILNACKQTP